MESVLFSPVSDRDPCSADRTFRNVYRDGALLHIVRHYRPHKVYLFLTKRFQNFEAKDQRYTKMLKHVMPEVEIQFLYCPEEIQNVALFDQFDTPFAEYLQTIHQENPEDQLLVNVSSGTPQMQAPWTACLRRKRGCAKRCPVSAPLSIGWLSYNTPFISPII